MSKYTFLIFLIIIFFSGKVKCAENDYTNNVRTFISILDYIGSDYQNSVKLGRVINVTEYSEMNEFIDRAIILFDSIGVKINSQNREEIFNDLNKLKNLIRDKANREIVFKQANKIRSEILVLNLIPASPAQWPSILKGKKIFDNNCASCHGFNGNGNGLLSKNLDPKPADFLNDTLMNTVSPLQVYNTTRLGISGTSMPPFKNLSDKETWDVAFYVSSLRFKKKYKLSNDSLSILYEKSLERTKLYEVSVLSDLQLLKKLSSNFNQALPYLAALRLHEPASTENTSIELTSAYLDKALKYYQDHNFDKAYQITLSAYLEGIEPFEQQLQSVNDELKNELEAIMFDLRTDIKNRKPIDLINKDVTKAKVLIAKAASELNDRKFTFWFSFFLAASIILREGIEAFLIIITILGVLKSIGATKATKWVHGGWVSALIIGIASMFFVNTLISFGARNRELMEALGSLIAVIILLYVGFWLHSKTEAKKWKEFVENKILKLINSKKIFGLAVMSFVVVFREAFESVVFLSTIDLEANHTGINGIYFGAGSALIVVLVLAWLAVKFAIRLPIKKLFKYSAIIIIALSIVLTGKAIHAFQEGGYLDSTHLFTHLRFEYFGIYPTLETTISQIIVFALTVVLWRYGSRIALKA